MEALCEKTITEYLSHLGSQFVLLPDDDGCRIVTPFERQDGEFIEVRIAEQNGGRVLLTDDSATSDYLFVNGLHLEGNDALFKEAGHVARRCGAVLDMASSELFVRGPAIDVGAGLHRLIMAIISVGDLLYRRTHRSISTFDDEVEAFFLDLGVMPQKRFDVYGQSSIHSITFYVNSSRQWLVEPVSVMSKSAAKNKARLLAFQWMDIKNVTDSYQCVAILDDRERQMEQFWTDEEISGPLVEYSDIVVEWAQRSTIASRLLSSN